MFTTVLLKKKINSFTTFFSAKLPAAAFLLSQQADARSSLLKVPLLCAGNQEESQAQLAVSLA